MDLEMTASDDELGLRRWSGRGRENGMNPRRAGKGRCITGSLKNRDIIIHYNTSAFWLAVKQKYFTIQYDTSFMSYSAARTLAR